jgi:hypothetical protein
MMNFVLLTDTPGRVASFLQSRGIIQQTTNLAGQQSWAGVLPGMEWVEVPNPIITDPGSGVPGEAGYVPPTYDTRHAYLVKFAHDSETEKSGAFRTWLLNNSSVVTAPAGWTINGEPVGDARKVTGQNVWLVADSPERFGVWQ